MIPTVFPLSVITSTVEPRYKEVGYNPSYNKVNLLVPALYISVVIFILI